MRARRASSTARTRAAVLQMARRSLPCAAPSSCTPSLPRLISQSVYFCVAGLTSGPAPVDSAGPAPPRRRCRFLGPPVVGGEQRAVDEQLEAVDGRAVGPGGPAGGAELG